jgi:ATP-dependent DNA helicase RecQ
VACEELGIAPLKLGRLLASQSDLTVQEGPRLVCLELLPISGDAGARLNQILARARQEARRRIQQVMAYATGHTCRHVALAAHLGEVLGPCGTVCDNCLDPVAMDRAGRAAAPDIASAARSRLTADAAFAVLNAVRTLPFPMGKTGLVRLLLGSVESRVRADRSASFGALSAFKKGKIESLIDRLVDDGFLFRDLEHEYKLIGLTERGAAAGPGDLAEYDEEASGLRAVVGNLEAVDEAQLSPDDRDLLQRLHEWRRDRASRDAVPPYVVAHNSSLIDVAQYRPRTHDELTKIKGYGQARAEKYGEEIIAIIEEAAAATDPA